MIAILIYIVSLRRLHRLLPEGRPRIAQLLLMHIVLPLIGVIAFILPLYTQYFNLTALFDGDLFVWAYKDEKARNVYFDKAFPATWSIMGALVWVIVGVILALYLGATDRRRWPAPRRRSAASWTRTTATTRIRTRTRCRSRTRLERVVRLRAPCSLVEHGALRPGPHRSAQTAPGASPTRHEPRVQCRFAAAHRIGHRLSSRCDGHVRVGARCPAPRLWMASPAIGGVDDEAFRRLR